MASFYARIGLPRHWHVILLFLVVAAFYALLYLPDLRLGPGRTPSDSRVTTAWTSTRHGALLHGCRRFRKTMVLYRASDS